MEPYEKIGQMLSKLSVEPPKGFDEKFWKRFQLEKGTVASGAATAGVAWTAKIAASLCVGLIGITTWVVFAVKDEPTVRVVQGVSAPIVQKLKIGDTLQTGLSNWLVLELEKGYRVKLQPGSEIKVEKLKPRWAPGKTVLYLSKGQTLVSIGDQVSIKYPLEIRTPNAFARAMGTQFAVTAPTEALAQSQISVVHGVVHVGTMNGLRPNEDTSINVPAGNLARVENGRVLAPEAIVERKKLELEELFQYSRRNQVILLISMGPDRLQELLAPCIIYIRFETPGDISSKLADIARGIAHAGENSDPSAHLASARALESLVGRQSEIDEVPVLLFVGAYYHHLGYEKDAVRVFDRVASAHPDSFFRSLAWMAEARIEAEKLDHPQRARELAQRILEEHPQSYEAPLASELLSRIDPEVVS